jgi:hypothetical protein
MDAVLRARAKKHCRAVHVKKGGVAHRLVAFWARLKFQCFVRKFATEHFKFDLVQRAIFAHRSHSFLAIHGRAAIIDFQKSPQRHPVAGQVFHKRDKGPLVHDPSNTSQQTPTASTNVRMIKPIATPRLFGSSISIAFAQPNARFPHAGGPNQRGPRRRAMRLSSLEDLLVKD